MTQKISPTILILGASSAVAIAFARLACQKENARFILVGRNPERLDEILQDLKARGADSASEVILGPLGDPDAVTGLFDQIMSKCEQLDQVLLAYGVLGEQSEQQADPAALKNLLDANFVSAVMWSEAIANQFQTQGHGRLGVIGSVAGDRGRQSNYLYGATKGALERVCEGMAHRFADEKRISVTVIKPGFIDTPMTDHIEKGGPLWASSDKVADVIYRAMDKRRVRVYAPWFWRYILLIIRALPVPIMHKTKM